MATVRREGFTRLSRGEEGDEHISFKFGNGNPTTRPLLTRRSIIFVHGLRGHPRATWKSAPAAGTERNSDAIKKQKGFRSLFKRKKGGATDEQEQAQVQASASQAMDIFWPEQFLALDIPHAQVWTYGYNADMIGGLFQANNKNSISQHGRDLAVRLEREIDNEVRSLQAGGVAIYTKSSAEANCIHRA